MNGILIVNKKTGMTSRDVVNTLVKKLETKKIGHGGTLDPLATGVLVIGIGNGTKVLSMFSDADKEYICTFRLGLLTDTLDITGKILKEERVNISDTIIREVINDFPKSYNQEVPAFSAVKIKGRKLYEYARDEKTVELPSRVVQIKELELLNVEEDIVTIRTKVSKGTYIRSLVNDIAKIMDTNGTVITLERTVQGEFSLKNSIELDQVKANDIINLKDIFKDITLVDVALKNKIKHGSLLPNIYNQELINFVYNNELIAIYETYTKDITKIKPRHVFIKEG